MKYCRSCRAFVGGEEFADRPDPEILNAKVQLGSCRRYAPRPAGPSDNASDGKPAMASWPAVYSDDGCGEWEPAFQ